MSEQAYVAEVRVPDPGSDEDIRQLLADLEWCVRDPSVRVSVRAIVGRLQTAERLIERYREDAKP